ncbi:type II secretion system minor pseudopilin GspK [Oceanicoccus sp. KOV_DT_Chl]|uniref:type II secretion system minor pseudopilin GspK n=1 Tax=Oceanicoccus sp. KOV_DT_Chl TaxID=1904639 RepID=UPI000C7B8472|nr:type II secretion system minor pseudopilin GspK [Oceanicoccus sp. KOV_DT_Chl]
MAQLRVRRIIGFRANRQSGVALITVLLIFALAAIITSQVASRNYRDIRKTANFIDSKQSYHFALAGEQLARQLLYRDFSEGDRTAVDSLSDNWANIDQVFDIENGSMTIEIIDLHSRFNVNNLIAEEDRVNRPAAEEFSRLQSQLELSQDYTDLVLDWIDSDTLPREGGAEDEQYVESGYLAANQPLIDETELRLLQQMTAADYERIKDSLTALPLAVNDKKTGITKYNLNTLDAKLLKVLSVALDERQISQIEQIQRQGGLDTVGQWTSRSGLADLASISQQLTVRSEFFEVRVIANYQQRISVIRTHLYRDKGDGQLIVIKRQQLFE